MDKKKIIITTIVILVVVSIAVVGFLKIKEINKQKEEQQEKQQEQQKETKKPEDVAQKVSSINFVKEQEEALQPPKPGEEIAIMTVKDYGTIKLKLYPQVAPKAVENFVTHAKNGYFNDLTFHRVIDNFMIQGGDPTGTGRGGESIWKEPFKKEVDMKYFPFRGTLCMASVAGVDKSLGSQFFITQAPANQETVTALTEEGAPKNVVEAYEKFGGAPSLYMQYTVFGQVYEGMDVVDKIAKVQTDASDKPETPVVIESVKIEKAN